MKTLIICDDESVISKIDTFLQKNGIDTIIYRWLLKALDNLEEISPDSIIVSVYDYPRHWKTLAQFINANLCRKNAKLILYVPQNFSSEEKKKADSLNVSGFVESLDENSLLKILSLVKGQNLETKEIAHDSKNDKKAGGLLSRIENLYGKE